MSVDDGHRKTKSNDELSIQLIYLADYDFIIISKVKTCNN